MKMFGPPKVDSIIGLFHRTVEMLARAEEAHGSRASEERIAMAEAQERASQHEREAARAKNIAAKLRNLIEEN